MIFVLIMTYESLCFVENLFPQGKKKIIYIYIILFVKLVPIFLYNVL